MNPSSSNAKADGYPPPPIYPDTFYPITGEYYEGFMNAEIETTWIEIVYWMGTSPECREVRDQHIILRSNYDFDDDLYWINMTINEVEFFIADYSDGDINQDYCAGFSMDELMPFFLLVDQNPDYFFNAEEYGEEESLEFTNPWDMGWDFKNSIMLSFYAPDREFSQDLPLKSFIKGWHPCDDPPAELLSLINFFETVIIPIAREHPY